MKIKFIKFNDNVKIPKRSHYNDTGADIFMLNEFTVPAHSVSVEPLGFGIALPDGYTAFMQTRTSVAKRGLFIQQCSIDAGYRGEIYMIITNLTDNPITVKSGERLAYLVVHPCVYPELVEHLGDERGDGAFGSTNK